MSDWYIGQEVWIVPNDNREKPYSAKIAKIARKWMTLDPGWRGQVSKESGYLKPKAGYLPRARAWPSRAEYELWKSRSDKWKEFTRSIQYSGLPDHISDDDLDVIIGLVRGKNA